jgi:hypothetical protein
MTQVRTPELAPLFGRPPRAVAPTVEDGVRVGAATLAHASADLMSSTTVVVHIGPDDLEALCQLVRKIAETHDLEATINPRVGWCSVRFSRRKPTSS